MKRIYVLAALCALIFGAQLLVTCSNPLERDEGPDIDTVFEPGPPIIDTVIDTLIDTVEVFDTDTIFDTLIDTVTDTLIDTVEVFDTDTIFDTLIDTVTDTLIDTVEVFDTDTIFDTLIDTVTDTLIDTVEVVVPDSTCIKTICDKLSGHNHKIVWTFGNMAGTYLLTFEATVENNKPPKELIVTIDGEEYIWHTDQSLVFTIEATLDEYSTIKIHPDKPIAFGHYVYVCLTFGTP